MPFVTKNPSYYFSALKEESTDPLHVGLFLTGGLNEKKRGDLVALGKAIRESPRLLRCLWLRFKNVDEDLTEAFRAFGEAVVGTTTIQSLVFEGRAGTREVQCMSGFFAQNDLRGLQFRRTDADLSTFKMLTPFLSRSTTLKVFDISSNEGVDEEIINHVLDALLKGGVQLETLNINENNLDDQLHDEADRVSDTTIGKIARFASKTQSLSSLTLKLRHLDDIGLGEISLAVRRKDCSLKRLDLSGNFGNSGVKIFAEALKTNTSLRTVSFGCHKTLSNVGGEVLLSVVDPFSTSTDSNCSTEWENVKRSNHTLQSIYILDRPTVTVDRDLVTKLQSISITDPHRTFQRKCWHHIESNIEGISHIGLDSKHMPQVLAFVQQHGGMDHIFELIRSQNSPELFSNPSPERARISRQMERVEQENESLRELLMHEREKTEELHEENNYLRRMFQNKEEAKKCCLLPVVKLIDMWNLLLGLLTDPTVA